jgi:transposase
MVGPPAEKPYPKPFSRSWYETQVLRALLRTRKQLVREKASHVQRLQKTLEDANIKLDAVVTNLLG